MPGLGDVDVEEGDGVVDAGVGETLLVAGMDVDEADVDVAPLEVFAAVGLDVAPGMHW